MTQEQANSTLLVYMISCAKLPERLPDGKYKEYRFWIESPFIIIEWSEHYFKCDLSDGLFEIDNVLSAIKCHDKTFTFSREEHDRIFKNK